jgi:hypothetical protein
MPCVTVQRGDWLNCAIPFSSPISHIPTARPLTGESALRLRGRTHGTETELETGSE